MSGRRGVAALAAILAAGCPGPRAPASPATASAATPAPATAELPESLAAFPEAIPACSPAWASGKRLVFLTRIDACGPERAAAVLRHLDDIGVAEGWLELIGPAARVDELRALGCPTAVLCTDANAYAVMRHDMDAGEYLRLHLAARKGARPAP